MLQLQLCQVAALPGLLYITMMNIHTPCKRLAVVGSRVNDIMVDDVADSTVDGVVVALINSGALHLLLLRTESVSLLSLT